NYQNWEMVDPEKWVPDGYVCIRVDSRGAGRSPGYIDAHNAREAKDFGDCIDWTGAQRWSNGKVGLNGIPYFAVNKARGAGAQPGAAMEGTGRAAARRRLLPRALGALGQDQDAAPFLRQLGRARPAPARQHRGLHARGLEGEVARDPRLRALDALLYQLRRGPA